MFNEINICTHACILVYDVPKGEINPQRLDFLLTALDFYISMTSGCPTFPCDTHLIC